MKQILQRALKAKQEHTQKLVTLTIVTCRSYPDYTPVKSIGEKFIQSGAD